MYVKLTKQRFLKWLAVYTIVVDAVVLGKAHLGILSVIIVFPYLIIVPGLLMLLSLKMKSVSAWFYVLYAVNLSLLLLMVIGLVTNWIVPLFGIREALKTVPLLAVFSVCMVGLLFWAKYKAQPFNKKIPLGIHSFEASFVWPLGLVLLAVCGAIRLNNGASNVLTLLLLVLVAVDLFYIFKRSQQLSQSMIIFHIFCIGLSLLLMTSLRGWFITGHDVQREFFVFELAKSHWHWQVSLFRDPYNACLSITVLPTLFASILS